MAFFGLNVAVQGLYASQKALDIVSHNIANANNSGYSKQIGLQRANSALSALNGTGMIGTGVSIYEVVRQRNKFYDVKYWGEVSTLSQWETKSEFFNQMESILNVSLSANSKEMDSGFMRSMDDYFSALQALSTDPGSNQNREVLKTQTDSLTATINDAARQLQDKRAEVNFNIKSVVDKINSLASKISSLNDQIYKAEIDGSNANDLRDQRIVLVDELSALVNIEAKEEDKGGRFTITINGNYLVNHDKRYDLELYTKVDDPGMYSIRWSVTENEFEPSDGELKALFDIRDGAGIDYEYRESVYNRYNNHIQEELDEINALTDQIVSLAEQIEVIPTQIAALNLDIEAIWEQIGILDYEIHLKLAACEDPSYEVASQAALYLQVEAKEAERDGLIEDFPQSVKERNDLIGELEKYINVNVEGNSSDLSLVDSINAAMDNIKNINTDINSLTSQISGVNTDIANLASQIVALEQAIANIEGSGGDASTEIAERDDLLLQKSNLETGRDILVSDRQLLMDNKNNLLNGINTSTGISDSSVIIRVGTQVLVRDKDKENLVLEEGLDYDYMKTVRLENSFVDADLAIGSLRDLVNRRDSEAVKATYKGIPYYQQLLDEYARNLARIYNDGLTNNSLDQSYGGFAAGEAYSEALFDAIDEIKKLPEISSQISEELKTAEVEKLLKTGKTTEYENAIMAITGGTILELDELSAAQVKELKDNYNIDVIKYQEFRNIYKQHSEIRLFTTKDHDGNAAYSSDFIDYREDLYREVKAELEAKYRTNIENEIRNDPANSGKDDNEIKALVDAEFDAVKSEFDADFEYRKEYEVNKKVYQMYSNVTALNITVSRDIVNDVSKIPTGASSDRGESNNKNILELLGIRSDTHVFKEGSIEDYITSIVSNMGIAALRAETAVASQQTVVTQIERIRMGTSAVSEDEELIDMVRFEMAYNAAAKMVSTINNLYDTLINRMGV